MGKNKSEKPDKFNIQIENVDTPAKAVSNVDDTRPYEQKNLPKGAFKPNRGSK